MKSYVRYMVALSLLAAAPAAAQQTGRPGADSARGGRWEHGGRQHRPAFQGLLAHRQELQLTDAQVARLQEIGRRLDERNRPIHEQLRAHHEQFKAQRRAQMERLTPEQRRDTLRRLREERARGEGLPREMKPVVERMRANTRRAMEEAQRVLTPEQKRRARALVRERRELREEVQRERRRERGPRPRGDG